MVVSFVGQRCTLVGSINTAHYFVDQILGAQTLVDSAGQVKDVITEGTYPVTNHDYIEQLHI